MALSLNITVDERNDNKVVTFQDTSTGWGTPNFTDLKAISSMSDNDYGLVLRITINTSPDVSTIYSDIDLVALAGPFTTQAEMIFNISAANLVYENAPIGDINTELPDGIWDAKYVLVQQVSGTLVDVQIKSESILIIGKATKAVYDKLRLVVLYYNSEICKIRDIKEAMLYNTFLNSIRKNAYIAQRDEILEMIETLNRMLLNGSNYPW